MQGQSAFTVFFLAEREKLCTNFPKIRLINEFIHTHTHTHTHNDLKNDRMISVQFQGKPFNITGIQVYAPTSNAK